MRNFPVISDLVVDMGLFYSRMDMVGQRQVIPLEEEPTQSGIRTGHG